MKRQPVQRPWGKRPFTNHACDDCGRRIRWRPRLCWDCEGKRRTDAELR